MMAQLLEAVEHFGFVVSPFLFDEVTFTGYLYVVRNIIWDEASP